MGIFSPLNKRNAYVPPSDAAASPTLLTGSDPNLVRVSGGGDPPASNDDEQLAQQKPAPARPPVQRTVPLPSAPSPNPGQLMAQPGRGYGLLPQELIERDMSQGQKQMSRGQALLGLAGQPLDAGKVKDALPDDWERTKPSEVVDDLKRAAQRHNVPIHLLARLAYQEGKFNERDKLYAPLTMQSSDPNLPLGWVQMTSATLKTLKDLAQARGDIGRLRELASYSLANRAQAFDAAAEFLAYQHRVLGSWPAAVAGYNVGSNYIREWLDGKKVADPIKLRVQDPNGQERDKWKEMSDYLAFVFRGRPDEAITSDMYELGTRNTGRRVPVPIFRDPNKRDIGQISRDRLDNP